MNHNQISFSEYCSLKENDGISLRGCTARIDLDTKDDEWFHYDASLKVPPCIVTTNTKQRNKTDEKANGTWQKMYHRLLAYRDKHGHCRVPCRYKEDPQLGAWVATQRRSYKLARLGQRTKASLTVHRQNLLQKIGFEWSVANPQTVCWEVRFIQMLEFVSLNGHAQVPTKWEENSQLSNWVSRQRRDYQKLQSGQESGLTKDRIDLLNCVGFVWQAQRGGVKRILPEKGSLVQGPDNRNISIDCLRYRAQALLCALRDFDAPRKTTGCDILLGTPEDRTDPAMPSCKTKNNSIPISIDESLKIPRGDSSSCEFDDNVGLHNFEISRQPMRQQMKVPRIAPLNSSSAAATVATAAAAAAAAAETATTSLDDFRNHLLTKHASVSRSHELSIQNDLAQSTLQAALSSIRLPTSLFPSPTTLFPPAGLLQPSNLLQHHSAFSASKPLVRSPPAENNHSLVTPQYENVFSSSMPSLHAMASSNLQAYYQQQASSQDRPEAP